MSVPVGCQGAGDASGERRGPVVGKEVLVAQTNTGGRSRTRDPRFPPPFRREGFHVGVTAYM